MLKAMSVRVTDEIAHAAREHKAVGDVHKHDVSDILPIIRQLQDKLERYRQRRARHAGWTQRFIPTGLTALDNALPHGGLPCGVIAELLTNAPGCGAMSFAIRIAGNSIRSRESRAPSADPAEDRRSIFLVDTFKDFYPPAALQHGISIDRLIVVRVNGAQDVLWAVDQALRCSAVAVVIAPLLQLDERWSRRLQLAAETSGCLGIIIRPAFERSKSFAAVRVLIETVRADPRRRSRSSWAGVTASEQPSWASLGCAAFPLANVGDVHICRITLLKVREGMPAKPILVDLQHETGTLHLHSLPVDRSAARTG